MPSFTASQNIRKPERPDPFHLTADLGVAFDTIDMVFAQTRGEASAALLESASAKDVANLAAARASAIEDPIHVGPSEPTDGEVLWVDTDEDAPDRAFLAPHPSIAGLWALDVNVRPEPDPEPEPDPVNGEGYVGALAASSPYTSLAVRGVDDDGDVVSYDLVATGGGRTMTVRFQGEYVEGTGYIDGFQRIEEINLGAYLAGPRSNLEWATQLYATTTSSSGAQFAPYHGSTSSLMWQTSAPTYSTLSGAAVTMPAQGATTSLPDGLEIVQTVEGQHPSATATQLRVTTIHRFHPDGMIEVAGTWTALVDMKVGSVYAPMVPYQRDDITSLEHAGGTIALDNTAPSGTVSQSLPTMIDSGLLTSSSRPNLRIAWAWTDPDQTLRRTEPDRKAEGEVLFAQRRTDGINKIYHHVWETGSVVSAGTTWDFGAQWRYQEEEAS